MLAPAPRQEFEVAAGHPCSGCAVRRFAVCGVLGCEELAHFRNQGKHTRLAPGQSLFHEGDSADRVFTVTRGTLKLYKLLSDGRRQITGFMYPGDFLGVTFNDEYAFTAEALEPTELCTFRGRRFDQFVEEHDLMERELYLRAAHELAAAQEQCMLLGRKTAAERVASFLLLLAERGERRDGNEGRFVRLPMSRSDIADYLGVTKETVSRALSQLKNQRIIRLQAMHCVEILDREVLTQVAAGDIEVQVR